MKSKRWTNQDIENLAKDIKPERIHQIKEDIQSQISTNRLFGLETAISRRTEALFISVPYTDKITRTKILGQAHIFFCGGTGTGKTDLEQSIGDAIEAKTSRIQGDPELMPRHITGGSKFVENLKGERRVVFEPGPLLANIVLVDEASRIRPNSMASVVEPMEERSLTPKNEYIDDNDCLVRTLPVFPISGDYTDFEGPRFFQVGLTQNPHGDEEGNYANPQALLDRVTLFIDINRPSFENEMRIRPENVIGKRIDSVTNLAELLACGLHLFRNVRYSQPANEYLTRIIRNTNPFNPKRPNDGVVGPPELIEFVTEHVLVGASPRVNFHLPPTARVRAFFSGSDVIKPEHVQDVAVEVIAHRLRLKPEVEFSTSKEDVFRKILELTEVPKWK